MLEYGKVGTSTNIDSVLTSTSQRPNATQTVEAWTRNMALFRVRSTCLVFLVFVASVACQVTTHDDPMMSTLAPAQLNNITIGPSVKINYTLEVTASSPAVLDSVVKFTAQLYINPNRTKPEGRFRYLWLNTADHGENHTQSTHNSHLLKAFDEERTQAGEYLMTVIVKPEKEPRDIISFTSIVFKLTKRLNGKLSVKQDLQYQRNNVTFAVDRPIHFHINITDHFNSPNFPQYTYFWYNGSELIHETAHPHYDQEITQPSILHLQAVASAEFVSDMDDVNSLMYPPDITDKIGSFQEKLVFKESLANCSIVRVDSHADDQSVKLGSSLVLNITCVGSAPSAACWNVTKKDEKLNTTCTPSHHFHNTTQHQVSVPASEVGWYNVHMAIYNDISFQVMAQDFYVYNPDSVNVPALVFPIVFGMLGMVIVVVGGTYIMRLRRKHHVEVADFDFAPTISVKSSGPLSSVLPAMKQFFTSRVQQPDHRTFQESQGLLRSDLSLYDSL